jgi:hypothetical protein
MTTETRLRIDNILRKCATIYSNLGTKTPFDVGSKDVAKQKEKDLLEQIKDLDEEFYNTVTNSKYYAPKKEEVEEQKS